MPKIKMIEFQLGIEIILLKILAMIYAKNQDD